jgi:DNA-binding transcriptional MerR regulator
MYGTTIGNVLGTLTHIDGKIQTVGIDCGSEGLKQIPYEQLVLQGDVVICIPGWRIDTQKILREKRLTLSRLKALMDILSENDAMQSDADVIHDTYKTKLMELDEAESKVRDELSTRLEELDSQENIVKVMLFDAKVQFKSEEITDSTFETIQKHCNNLLERLSHERVEINNVQRRIEELSLESIELTQPKKEMIQESAVSYLSSSGHTITEYTNILPEPPIENSESPIQASTEEQDEHEDSPESI